MFGFIVVNYRVISKVPIKYTLFLLSGEQFLDHYVAVEHYIRNVYIKAWAKTNVAVA